jgi:vitamin B12 transporter
MAILVLLVALGVQTAPSSRVAGVVTDATSLPLPGATVEVDGRIVALSDERGVFEIVVTSGAASRFRVALDGFEPYESQLAPGVSHVEVTLVVKGIEDRVRVTARPPRVPVDPVFARQPIDVYRTPGAQGDLFRALQTLPGVAAPDDAAGLFVRGGDVSEVLVSLDDAVIAHPYRYETPTGGFRGAVDPLLITGIAFSTGGFAARHGNALSAVMDLRGLDRPALPEMSGTFGLAGAAASIGVPVGDRVGVRAAVNRTFTQLLFAVNGSPRRFEPPPGGWDGSLGFSWDVEGTGRFKVFAMTQRDSAGLEAERDAFAGWLSAANRHSFVSARWDGSIGPWATAATFGNDRYTRRTIVGVLDHDVEDETQSWRLEAARPGGAHMDWRLGANGAFTRATIAGNVPVAGGDLSGISGVVPFDVNFEDWYAGTYLDATTTIGIVSTTTGARVDRFGLAGATTIGPRLNVRVALGRSRALRYATGIYHQAPAALYYDRVRGAERLAPMRAVHHIIGYETGREAEGLYLRVEGYVKRYRDLPLEEAFERGYSSAGHGWSRGVDLFVQRRSSRLDLRGIASWLGARRRWTPVDQRHRYDVPEGTWRPDFEIPWSLQLVATVPVGRGVAVAGAWRTAAGRPHTPVVGALKVGEVYAPIFGDINSERLPRYERLDLSVNWLFPAGAGAVVFFASLDNALGRANFFDYRYAPDYSSRRPTVSTSQRSVYVGATFRR